MISGYPSSSRSRLVRELFVLATYGGADSRSLLAFSKLRTTRSDDLSFRRLKGEVLSVVVEDETSGDQISIRTMKNVTDLCINYPQ
jgi:hypothetical protein